MAQWHSIPKHLPQVLLHSPLCKLYVPSCCSYALITDDTLVDEVDSHEG